MNLQVNPLSSSRSGFSTFGGPEGRATGQSMGTYLEGHGDFVSRLGSGVKGLGFRVMGT